MIGMLASLLFHNLSSLVSNEFQKMLSDSSFEISDRKQAHTSPPVPSPFSSPPTQITQHYFTHCVEL
jgi:hypothetical protein